jgi:hypothetical protein
LFPGQELTLTTEQGDQIGRNFAIWAIFYGEIFSRKKLPKSNRKPIKQFYIVNLTKTWLGDFLGDFFCLLAIFSKKHLGPVL